MSKITIERRGRLVISHWPAESTKDEVNEFFDEMHGILEDDRCALILNALAVKKAPVEVRDTAGKRLKGMDALLRKQLVAQATVLSSTLVRGALATVHFFSPPGYPVKTFSSLDDAKAWCEEKLHGPLASSA